MDLYRRERRRQSRQRQIAKTASEGLQRGEPGTFVYVVKPDNTVSVRPVKLGTTDEGYVAVLSGLDPGDTVVIDGTDRLRDGAPVSVAAPGKSGTAGAATSHAGSAASPSAGSTPAPGQVRQGGHGGGSSSGGEAARPEAQ